MASHSGVEQRQARRIERHLRQAERNGVPLAAGAVSIKYIMRIEMNNSKYRTYLALEYGNRYLRLIYK